MSDWVRRNLRGMLAAFASFGRSAGGQVIELEGVQALVNPAVAERSVFNSVVYLDPRALAAARDELAAVYEQARCAWTVWVPEGDAATARLLAAAGHRLDALPRAMGAELDAVGKPAHGDLDWTDRGGVEEMAALNDEAYGFATGTWLKGVGRNPDGLRVYLARVEGRPAATVCALDVDDDCSIWNVATAPWARGRGLSGALMRKAMADAAGRGRRTSTLQATKLGVPVYRRCGYTDFGALQMWELRPPALGAHAAPGAPA